jgi:Subtilase family
MKRLLILILILLGLFFVFFYFSLGSQPKSIAEDGKLPPITNSYLDSIMQTSYPNYAYLERIGYVLRDRRMVLLSGDRASAEGKIEATKSVEKELESYWKWQILLGKKDIEEIPSLSLNRETEGQYSTQSYKGKNTKNIISRIFDIFKVADVVNVIVDANKTCNCDGGLLLLAGPDLHKVGTTLNPDGEIIATGVPHFDPQSSQIESPVSMKLPQTEPNTGYGKLEAISVGIIDSGINLKGENLIVGSINIGLNYNFITSNPADTNNITDPNSVIHGTKIARIIKKEMGTQPVNIVGLKTFDSLNIGNLYDNLCAIMYAIKHKIKVVNISWGGKKDSPIFQEVMKRAVAANLIIVCSAGNENIDIDVTPYFPACYSDNAMFGKNVVTVTSLYKESVCMNRSGSGTKIDVTVRADTSIKGRCLHFVPNAFGDSTRASTYESGTSYAAPYVTAAVIKSLMITPPFVKNAFIASLPVGGKIKAY